MAGIHTAQLVPGSREERTTSRGTVAKCKGNRHPLAIADNFGIIAIGMMTAFHAGIVPTAEKHFYRRKSANFSRATRTGLPAYAGTPTERLRRPGQSRVRRFPICDRARRARRSSGPPVCLPPFAGAQLANFRQMRPTARAHKLFTQLGKPAGDRPGVSPPFELGSAPANLRPPSFKVGRHGAQRTAAAATGGRAGIGSQPLAAMIGKGEGLGDVVSFSNRLAMAGSGLGRRADHGGEKVSRWRPTERTTTP